jgi:hypothetical protein
MRRIPSLLAATTALFLVLAGTAASAGPTQVTSRRALLKHGAYSHYWTNSANDTLYIQAYILYDTSIEKGQLGLIISCYRGIPSNGVTTPCKLKGGTKVWGNYTTGGTLSASISAQDGGWSYGITGTFHSMVDSNSYYARGKGISVLFHGTGRTSLTHSVCSVPWSELYGTGAGPACSPA